MLDAVLLDVVVSVLNILSQAPSSEAIWKFLVVTVYCISYDSYFAVRARVALCKFCARFESSRLSVLSGLLNVLPSPH
jgi:hypothetical protein